MLSLDDLLAPITSSVFHADYDDRKPLHIPAAPGAAKQTLLDWDRFNALLDQTSIWTAQSLKVLYNGQRVPPPRYCHDAATGSGTANRPSPAKVKVLLAQGASLVLDEVQDLVPSIRALTPALGRTFAGQISANLYCSFGGVQAFGTHFDLHHVFAIQCEGEKVWTLYSNRADAPTTFPIDNEAVQTYFLDTQTGRWQSTILGMQARQISVALGNKYRAAMVVGLAILPQAMSRKVAPAPDDKRKGVPLMAGLAAVVVVIGAGAVVAQAMRPADVGTAIPTAAPAASAPVAASSEPIATAEPTAEASVPA